MVELDLPIGKAEIVKVRSVRCLLAVSVHLVVDGDSIPAGRYVERRIGLVQHGGYAIQRYGLVKK